MKKSLVVASLLFCGGSSTLMAADYTKDWFIGGEFGGQNTKMKVSGQSTDYENGILSTDAGDNQAINVSETLKSTYESLKFGKYFTYGRVYGALSKQNNDSWNINDESIKYSSISFSVGYDYLFKNQSAFTPFIGITAGYTKGKFDGELSDQLGLGNPKGFTYGANVGTLYSLTNALDLEIGARYLKHNIDKSFDSSYEEIDGGNTYTGTTIGKIEIKDSIQYYIGLNYNF